VVIEALAAVFMPFRSDVAIGVGGLADAGVPELSLNPPDVRTALEQPGRERVPSGVIGPVGELGAAELPSH